MTDFYYEKYLKYKNKYLNLKNAIELDGGGGKLTLNKLKTATAVEKNTPSKCKSLEKDIGISAWNALAGFPMTVISDKKGYNYYNAKKNGNMWTAKWCGDSRVWNVSADTVISQKILKNKSEFFKFCQC